MRTVELLNFIERREEVRLAREKGLPRCRWTADPILAKYHFCNVRREHDRVTIWIRENMREPFADHDDLWFWMAVARWVNLPATLAMILEKIPSPDKWNEVRFVNALYAAKLENGVALNGAYMMTTHGSDGPLYEYIGRLLSHLRAERKSLRPREGELLESYWWRLSRVQGMGSFMTAQVIADTKHAAPQHLAKAIDASYWAASGTGSRRGMRRLLGHPAKKVWTTEEQWREEFVELQRDIQNYEWPRPDGFDGQDLQNCLCEFDKYERARLGEGRPKRVYTPHEEKRA